MALVNYERDGQVVTLTLNRPEKLNAFSDELVGALGDALHRFDTDDEAHIAILHGSGRAFSSGACPAKTGCDANRASTSSALPRKSKSSTRPV